MVTVEQFDDAMKCPICGENYQHLVRSYFVDGEDSYKAGWKGKGSLHVLVFEGECWHTWELCFGFHKGDTFQFVRFPEGEQIRERSLEMRS